MPSGHKNEPKKRTKAKPAENKNNSNKAISSVDRDQASNASCSGSSRVSLEIQQLLLDIFKNAFSTSFNDTLPTLIQEVKQHLFHREFHTAFGQEASLEAYAIRWSPARALVYLDILCHLPQVTANLTSCSGEQKRDPEPGEPGNDTPSPALPTSPVTAPSADQQNSPQPTSNSLQDSLRVVCLGGGAGAEIVALGGFLGLLNSSTYKDVWSGPHEKSKAAKLNITAIDVADWSSIMDMLYSCIISNPPLPTCASTTAQITGTSLVDRNACKMLFLKQDVLKMDGDHMRATFKNARLVTLMFTLNELYSTSISATTNLLLSMTSILEPGSLLLVVDSPGSYSTVGLGRTSPKNSDSTEKKYPMQWLLDHTLLDAATIGGSKEEVGQKQWEKLHSNDSTWFRLPPGLMYPIPLEDMRYQIHLYIRL